MEMEHVVTEEAAEPEQGDSADEQGSDKASVQVWTAANKNTAGNEPGLEPGIERGIDKVAEESAVALVYNGLSHAVMMVSPHKLKEFAMGFSLTEGIISSLEDVYDLQVTRTDLGDEVEITLSTQRFARLKDKRRSLTGRTGCGICGAESLQQIRLPVTPLDSELVVSHAAVQRATRALDANQPLQQLTGAVHGAAWCQPDGAIQFVCEDVGRHNALDKLIGRLFQEGMLGSPGFLLISSRASYEIVQKAAMAKIAIVVAVSAPTTMALDVAHDAGITLVGFSRIGRHVVYTNSQRLSQA